jgi:hypothetical protein
VDKYPSKPAFDQYFPRPGVKFSKPSLPFFQPEKPGILVEI